jgi:hypothetical protein
MNTRQIVLLGGFVAVLLAGIGVLKIKHGLGIGAALVVTGFLLPDTPATAGRVTT